jgi:alpha-2-macroglobulin
MQSPIWLRRTLGTAVVVALSACAPLRPAAPEAAVGGADVPTTADPFANPFRAASLDTTLRSGVFLRLADVVLAPGAVPTPPVVRPLPPAAAEALLARLVGPVRDRPQEQAFHFAPRSLPAPRPGRTIQGAFSGAAAAAPVAAADGPLRAIATSPRGGVTGATQVSVTFSRPMVRLSSLEGAPAGVRLTPQPPGSWRWLDPYTLVFEAAGGLPNATRYEVEVPAGITSADGAALTDGVRWTFATPAASVREVFSTDAPEIERPVLVILFDQRVAAAAVLPFLRLEVDGRAVPLRLATDAERALPLVHYRIRAYEADRLVVVRPENAPPAGDGDGDRAAVLRVLAGVPSLEGAERTAAEATYPFQVRRGMRVVEHGCGRAARCRPGVPWTIRFSHSLRQAPDSGRSWVRVEPALAGATVEVWNDHLIVLGAAEEGVTYTVHLEPSIATWSGDTLGATAPVHFTIGPPDPAVWLPGDLLAVMPADRPARYPILAEGADAVRVVVRAVDPADWFAWARRLAMIGAAIDDLPSRPGTVLFERVLPVTHAAAGAGEAVVDLEAALDAAGGHVLLVAEPVAAAAAEANDGAGSVDIWIQRGGLTLDVAEDGEALTVRASSSRDGQALRGARLDLFADGTTSGERHRIAEDSTDAAGLSRLVAPAAARGHGWLLQATHENGTTLFAGGLDDRRAFGSWQWQPRLRHHVVLDRPIHAPGDTVRFAGWLRRAGGLGREPVAIAEATSIQFVANGPRGEDIAEGTLVVGRNGRVQGAFPLPAGVNSGRGLIGIEVPDLAGRAYVPLTIQDVRRPNFEVTVLADPGPYTAGDRLEANVRARYFTGGGMPDTEVVWRILSGPARFAPPGTDGYAFGLSHTAWRTRSVEPSSHTGITDDGGEHGIAIHLDSVAPRTAMQLRIEATVADLDQQRRSAAAAVLVHPADVAVGLRTPARFVRAGEALVVDALVVDLDGRTVPGRPIALRALRQDRGVEQGRGVVRASERASCDVRSDDEPVRCLLDGLIPGDYLVVASVRDTLGRTSESELAVRVASETIPAAARTRQDTVTIAADRDEYAPGDTAVVLLQASFPARHALLTIRRAGVLDALPVTLDNGTAVVRLPIDDRFVPNVQLHVTGFGADGRSAAVSTELRVAARTRALTVDVAPDAAEVAPGSRAAVTVTVTDDAGRPVPGADVVLSGVDEALLALSHRHATDPLVDMYPTSAAEVDDRALRTHAAPRVAAPAQRPRAGTGAVAGVVIDAATGRPLRDAWVELAGTAIGSWTGADGSYHLNDIPPAVHRIEARVRGYVTGQQADVVVEAGHVARTHFLLLTHSAAMAGSRSMLRLRAAAARIRGRAVALNEVVVTGESSFAAAPAIALPSPPPPEAGASTEQGAVRRNFSPVAAFVADARTGMDGTAEIVIDVPDNLTRYRLRATAAAGDRKFGAGEAPLTARIPLMARPVLPRFLNRGDRFDVRVLVENRTGAALDADVAVRAANVELTGPAAQRVTVPAEDRVELRFPALATAAGTARFQVAAVAADPTTSSSQLAGRDAAEAVIPVYTPALTESFAVYGQIDGTRAVAYPVRIPTGTVPGESRIEVGFSTTAAHGLHDALWFLWDCYFELPEVWASRTLALSALGRVPAGALPWTRALIDDAIERDVTHLARLQLREGGWSLWTSLFDADPFVSVHATHALYRARVHGVSVPERTLADALEWLRRLDETAAAAPQRLRRASPFAADYPLQARRAVQAYALDVRRLLGDDVAASAAALFRDAGAGALPAEALAWLLPALAADTAYAAEAADARRALLDRVVRPAGTAGVVSPYDAGGRDVFYSPRRTDAVVLGALVHVGATPDLVAALARGLMAHRTRGRWANTQENAFAVAALADYLASAEAVEPAMVARAWAGPRLAGEHAFRGRSDVRYELVIPADSAGRPGDELPLVLAREGAGRLYYRAGIRYARAGMTPPATRGFEVARTYEAVDDSADVRRDEEGTWHVRLGARVRVRVHVAAAGPRHHVALIDPLPAGFEALNPFLRGTSGSFAEPAMAAGATDWAKRFPAQHVNVGTDRMEAFTTLLHPGTREFVYLALATTPGTFTAPAPRAEEMYAPETFGRGAAERVIVEAMGGGGSER